MLIRMRSEATGEEQVVVESIGVRLDALISICPSLQVDLDALPFCSSCFQCPPSVEWGVWTVGRRLAQYIVAVPPSGFSGCGLSCADFNGDSWDDITLSNGRHDQAVCRRPNGPELMQILTGTEGRGVLWIDVDEDGDLDLWVVRFEGRELHIQGPDGTLTEEGLERGLPQLEGWRPRG